MLLICHTLFQGAVTVSQIHDVIFYTFLISFVKLFKEKGDQVPKSAITYYKKIAPLAYNQGPLGIFGILKK